MAQITVVTGKIILIWTSSVSWNIDADLTLTLKGENLLNKAKQSDMLRINPMNGTLLDAFKNLSNRSAYHTLSWSISFEKIFLVLLSLYMGNFLRWKERVHLKSIMKYFLLYLQKNDFCLYNG